MYLVTGLFWPICQSVESIALSDRYVSYRYMSTILSHRDAMDRTGSLYSVDAENFHFCTRRRLSVVVYLKHPIPAFAATFYQFFYNHFIHKQINNTRFLL